MSINKTLVELRGESGIMRREWCSAEENMKYCRMITEDKELPENIYITDGQNGEPIFYKLTDKGMSYEEKMEYLQHKQLHLLENQNKMLHTVKKVALFFACLAIISFVGTLIALFSIL